MFIANSESKQLRTGVKDRHIATSEFKFSPAKTGRDNNNKIAVTNILQTNNGNLCKLIPLVLMFNTVVIKLIAG